MRRFNPDKELNKIKNGNKNKILYSVIALLLIVAVGSTYALYQVRHTNKLVFNTVSEFVKKDIVVSVLIDNESKPEFPTKEEGYVYSDYECENDGIITFDSENWEFTLKNNQPDKCVIKFSSDPFKAYTCKNLSMSECLLQKEQHTSKQLAYDDPDGNARYIGATPSNYIWFNCLKYNDLNNDNAEDEQHKCERWRIIGSFKNITIADEKVNTDNTTKANLAKIIRADSIGNLVWATSNINNWANADLQISLNNDYLNSNDNGTYTSETLPRAINATTLNMIENVRWNLGGWNTRDITASEYYEKERLNNVPSGAPVTWNGKVALMYSSDYGFATNGSNNGVDRKTCLATNLFAYSSGCKDTDWLYISGQDQWTLTPSTNGIHYVSYIQQNGYVGYRDVKLEDYANPALYLKSNIQITGGQGTFEEPYIIS